MSEGTTRLTLTTKEFGGTKEVDVVVLPAPTPSPTPSPVPYYPSSGGSGGSGGGGGGGMPGATPTPTITETVSLKVDSPVLNSGDTTWAYDPVSNKFKLTVNMNGQQVPASNVFVTINEMTTESVDGKQIAKVSQNTYFFNSEGNMTTGWLKTSDGKWYFFENQKTANEGRMVTGWKQIGNDWYYFTNEGSMLTNATTPDGYQVGADGKLIS